MEPQNFNWVNRTVLKLIERSHGDPVDQVRKIARNLVSKAQDLGWSGPPFNPFDLAKLLNIGIYPNTNVLDARISQKKGNKLIVEFNPNQKASRIYFSIAHEIGHALLPDSKISIRNRAQGKLPKAQWELEFLCNIAASEILLPYYSFAPDANSIRVSIDNLLYLSEKYSASLEAVLLRFTEVVEKPFAMLIAAFKSEDYSQLFVDYFKASKSFRFGLQKGFQIPKESSAYECVNPGWTSKALEKWLIFDNIESLLSG